MFVCPIITQESLDRIASNCLTEENGRATGKFENVAFYKENFVSRQSWVPRLYL